MTQLNLFLSPKSEQRRQNLKPNFMQITSIIYFEILSELGFLGFVVFFGLFFYIILKKIINFYKTNNYLVLASTLYVLVVFLPLLPSGSFFVSFGATIFWINFSFMVSNFNE